MIPANNLRKGVLVFSAALVVMLLWLSISFLLVANTERKDARFLTQFMETDALLRDAAIVLAEERSASYWLTGIDGLFFAVDSLIQPRAKTDDALAAVTSHLRKVISDQQFSSHLRFQPTHLRKLVVDFEKQISGLENKRTTLEAQLQYPANLRDKTLQLEVLSYYRKMIESLETLRHGMTYITSEQSRATQNIFAISDAAWNISLSNQLLTALFEGYITGGNTALGDAHTRATALQNNIEENLQTIRRIDAYTSIGSELHTLAADLNLWFTDNYLVPVRRLSLALTNNTKAPYTNYDWRQTSAALDEHTKGILKHADKISRENVAAAESRATRNLAIDIALVLVSLLLMIFATWIVKRIHHQATHDELTGLSNRRHFKTHCEEIFENNHCKKIPISLLKIDLHKFKAINDSYGQVVGDKLLQQVGTRLKSNVSPTTMVARLGGDEYAVLLNDTDRTRAKYVANSLVTKLANSYDIDGQSLQLGICIGYASYPQDAENNEELRKAADLALHGAKQTGQGTVLPFEASIAKAFQERLKMETELATALDNNEFELHYQPQFDLENCVVDGVEALIRWRHPARGMVSPFHFIPIAEDAGLLPAIGQWVINEAARESARWKSDFGLHLRMSVNVSAHQFLHGDIVKTIKDVLIRENLNPSSFEIEITESVAMAELDLVVSKLNALHELGVRIALDDFGTGYSSLSYLQDLPLDTLKIDRSFITKIDNGTCTQRLLLESIASMAQLLDFHTVAEGVETDNQLRQVQALGIDTVQGYYYSKPVPGDQIPADVKAIDSAHYKDKSKAA